MDLEIVCRATSRVDDGIFVDYANKVILKGSLNGNLKKVYESIINNLYSEQKVKEYWIVNGLHSTIEVYKLNKKGLDLEKVYQLGEEIRTEMLSDFVLKTVDIFKF